MAFMMSESTKNIAFIHGDFPFGGAEKVTLDISGYLASEGYRIFVFATRYMKDKMPEGHEYPIEVIILPQKDVVKSRTDAEFICRKIAELDIKVIVPVAKRLKYIEMIRRTGAKIVYAHHNMPFHEARAYIDRAWAKGMRSPLRFIEWLLVSYPKYVIFREAGRREMNFYRGSYRECDRYVMLCREYGDEIVRRLGLDPDDNKIRVIENYQTLPESINFDKENIILYTGRISYADKRLDRLVKAWNLISDRLPDWRVLIVGEGKDRKHIERLIRRTRAERISLEGFTNDVRKYYDRASILALVSTYEGWPLSLTEAQSNGVIPIVFGSIAATRSIIGQAGKYGFVVPPFDIRKFADTLYETAVMPEDKKLEMRKDIVGKIAGGYTPEKIGKKWKELFDELICTDER